MSLLFFILLISSSLVRFIKLEIVPAGMLCNPQVFKMIEARFGDEKLKLCLKLKPIGSSPLTSRDSALILDPEAEDDPSDEIVKGLPLSNFTMAYGFPAEDPSSGSAEGYIGDDHNFYGLVYIGNRTFHADPYGRDRHYRNFGTFEHDVTSRHKRSRHAQVDYDRHFLPYQIENPIRRYGSARGRVCDLLLLADKSFFDNDANSSLTHVVRRMIHAVAQADVIFRNADFNEDGIPDNIGFQVKYILVLTSKDTNKRIFGHLGEHKTVDGKEYLMKFARLRRLSEVCLGIAFTGHAFHNRTLGLSFTSLGGGVGGAAGGLCDRRAYGRSYNTLAIAHSTTDDEVRVPERISAMTLAHELGHSFGAHHDDDFPNAECRGYLMGSQSSSSLTGKVMEFSLCSKRYITSTLNGMSYCLTDENKPFCGNGIVEEGEACDCGLPSRCNINDPCCTPRAGGALMLGDGTLHKEGCSVSPTANCHPSQGLCCLADCKYADLSKSGIDCRHQDMDCKCHNDTRSCRCGLGGRCLEDSSCHASECALLGLRECHCIRSPGGALGDARKCGICCILPNSDGTSPQCVGAEEAAYTLTASGSLPPDDWPGDDYIGPNVTIRLCKDSKCKTASLRAWSLGSKCVTRGVVGVCSPRGVCSTMLHTPRSNVFPAVTYERKKPKDGKVNGARRALFKCYFVILSLILHFTLN